MAVAVADWVAAIGTLGAFVVALRLFTIELDIRRATQASLVAAWLRGSPESWRTALVLRVSNQSEQPVYGLRVWLIRGPDCDCIHESRLVPSRRGERESFYELAVRKHPHPGELVDGVAVEFTDAMGLRWRREHDGGLTQLGGLSRRSVSRWRLGRS
jgi:hypothetical protein